MISRTRRSLAATVAVLPVAGVAAAAQARGSRESTFERIGRTKALRIAALPGKLPYFRAQGQSLENVAEPLST